MPIDWEHSSLKASARRAPAAGWIHKLWYTPGVGLKALVEWTDKARAAIRAGEYRYLSPVVLVRKDDRRAVALHSAALTNLPAIPRMEKLAASTMSIEENAMPEEKPDGKEEEVWVHVIKEIASIVGAKISDDDLVATLAAIREKVKKLVGSEGEAIASSVREILGLEADAGKDEIILAMTSRGTEAAAELAAIKEAEAERIARERVDKYVQENKINPNDKRAMAAAMSLAREHPDRFDALMVNYPPHVPSGQTKPPDRRQSVIAKAMSEFAQDVGLQKATSCAAYVDMKLRDAGFTPMCADEIRQLCVE